MGIIRSSRRRRLQRFEKELKMEEWIANELKKDEWQYLSKDRKVNGKKVAKFTGSLNWYRKVRKRHGFTVKAVTGKESG